MKKANFFYGRKQELLALENQMNQKRASFVVITGRRRIGKSRLIEEFAKKYRFVKFTGLAPSVGVNAQTQRTEFARKLQRYFDLPPLKDTDWADLFDTLAEQVQREKIVLLLDEISWMGMEDGSFLPKLRNLWDEQLKKNSDLLLVVCGSISSWIEENILSSTGFLGRVNQVIFLQELSLLECNEFFERGGGKLSVFEKFQILGVTGGVPLYLENVDPVKMAVQNIQALCFTPGGLLVREFDQIFSDLFSKRYKLYKNIVEKLASGPLEPLAVCEKMQQIPSGYMTEYLQDLVTAGFIQRDYAWSIKKGTFGKLSQYRLSDNYLRFYLKYIEPKLPQIEQKTAVIQDITRLYQWPSLMGLQFENLVCHNRHLIFEALGLSKEDILLVGPYFQSKTQRRAGCQIDLLIQTQHQFLWACEIKFSKNPLGISLIEEMEKKIESLELPRGFSIRPVLIYAGELSESLASSGYFAKTLDFGKFLTNSSN